MRNKIVMAMLGVLAMAGAAQAEALTGKVAKRGLVQAGAVAVEVLPLAFLSEADRAILEQVGQMQPWYTAIAMSPDEGLAVEATVAAANFHDTDAASSVALAECEAKRKGAAPCAVVALVRPEGWAPGGFQLSSAATEGFRTDYLKARGPRALAVSAFTGQWAIGAGADAALVLCAAKPGNPADCAVVVQD